MNKPPILEKDLLGNEELVVLVASLGLAVVADVTPTQSPLFVSRASVADCKATFERARNGINIKLTKSCLVE